MKDEKKDEAMIKLHPGRSDDHQYKRTYSLDVRLSPVEKKALRDSWLKTDHNSMAGFVRSCIFQGDEAKVDLYFEEKSKEKNQIASVISELKKQGNNLNQIATQLNSRKEKEFLTQESRELLKQINIALNNLEEIKKSLTGK